MAEKFPNGYKTLREKEKLLVTSNFSFSHSVFKRLVSQGRQKESLCGNGLKKEIIILATLNFSSANAFSFVKVRVLLFGTVLNDEICLLKSWKFLIFDSSNCSSSFHRVLEIKYDLVIGLFYTLLLMIE